jgi:hypothetical protein
MTTAETTDVVFDAVTKLQADLRTAAATMGRDEARFLVDAYYSMQDQRIRTANPSTLFEAKLIFDDQSLQFAELTANGGAAATPANIPVRRLTTDAQAGSRVVRQTRRYMSYQAGKSQQIFATFTMGAAVAGVSKAAGYFEDDDGLFFEQGADGVYSICRRSSVTGSVVTTKIAQSAWNGDKLDGTGDSGFTVDFTKSAILTIDFEWLGVGIARFSFVVGGEIVTAHTFLHAGNISVPYMKTPTLPVRWEIEGDAVAEMDAICCCVNSEGGSPTPGILR